MRHEYDLARIEELASHGAKYRQIAEDLGVDAKQFSNAMTFRQDVKDAYKRGFIKKNRGGVEMSEEKQNSYLSKPLTVKEAISMGFYTPSEIADEVGYPPDLTQGMIQSLLASEAIHRHINEAGNVEYHPGARIGCTKEVSGKLPVKVHSEEVATGVMVSDSRLAPVAENNRDEKNITPKVKRTKPVKKAKQMKASTALITRKRKPKTEIVVHEVAEVAKTNGDTPAEHSGNGIDISINDRRNTLFALNVAKLELEYMQLWGVGSPMAVRVGEAIEKAIAANQI